MRLVLVVSLPANHHEEFPKNQGPPMDNRLVASGAANGTKHHWMTERCRAASLSVVHDVCLLRTSRAGPDAIILRLPLLQSHHRRLANPATGATNAQEESEDSSSTLLLIFCSNPNPFLGPCGRDRSRKTEEEDGYRNRQLLHRPHRPLPSLGHRPSLPQRSCAEAVSIRPRLECRPPSASMGPPLWGRP
jgi:hypothetical protein